MQNLLYRAGMSAVVVNALTGRPVFWISDQMYLVVALAITRVIFFAVRGLRLGRRPGDGGPCRHWACRR